MSKKFVTVQIPLVELSSDSEPSVQQPPPSPATSHGSDGTRTPRRFPTVSDDDEDDPETPPGYGRSCHDSPRPPARRSPTPPLPPRPTPMPAPRPPLVPRAPVGARMSVGPRPPYQLAARDFPPGFPPRPAYERGESSRQPDHRLQQMRHMDSLSAQMRDTRHAFFELQGSQTQILDRLGQFEQSVGTLRRDMDYRTEELTVSAQRTHEVLEERTTTMEQLLVGAVMVVLVAVLIGLLPRFFRM